MRNLVTVQQKRIHSIVIKSRFWLKVRENLSENQKKRLAIRCVSHIQLAWIQLRWQGELRSIVRPLLYQVKETRDSPSICLLAAMYRVRQLPFFIMLHSSLLQFRRSLSTVINFHGSLLQEPYCYSSTSLVVIFCRGFSSFDEHPIKLINVEPTE